MGSCVGKSKPNLKSEQKKLESKARTMSTQQITNEGTNLLSIADKKQHILPIFNLHLSKSLFLFELIERKVNLSFKIHRQFHYKEQLIGFRSSNQFNSDSRAIKPTNSSDSQINLQTHQKQITSIIQCTYKERSLWKSQGNITIVDDMKCYVMQNQPTSNQMQNQTTQSQIKAKSRWEEYMSMDLTVSELIKSRKVLSLKVEGEQIQIQQVSLSLSNEIQKLQKKYHDRKSIKTAAFSGVCYYNMSFADKSTNKVYKLLEINEHILGPTQIIIYQSAISPQIEEGQLAQAINHLHSYFQFACFVELKFGSFWSISSAYFTKNQNYYPYLAIQILKHLIDIEEVDEAIIQKNEGQDLNRKTSTILQFLTLSHHLLDHILFILQFLYRFQSLSQAFSQEQFIQKVIFSIANNLSMICEGIFIEFGFEIDENYHPYRKHHQYFIAFQEEINLRNQNKKQRKNDERCLIKHSLKKVVSGKSQIFGLIFEINSLILRDSSKLSQEYLREVVAVYECKVNELKLDQNWRTMICPLNSWMYLLVDMELKMSLYKLLLVVWVDAGRATQLWSQIQRTIDSCEYVFGQTMLLFLTLGGIISSFSGSLMGANLQEFYYLKCIDLCHRLYGDPRVCFKGARQHQQKWEQIVLQNLINIYERSADKKEYNYLTHLLECLKQDIPDEEIQQTQDLPKIRSLFTIIPTQTISGVLYLRSDIWSQPNQDSKSNYTESVNSTSSKRTKKSSYKISELETSVNLHEFAGVIKWGNNIQGCPSILPELKNMQVLVIASGNYHTVFLTEDGLFGWGESNSGQLGIHNKDKSYQKNIKLIKQLKIDRKKDVFMISCGNQHTAFILNGLLEMWGQEEGGIIAGKGFTFDTVACGGLHTLAIQNGQVYSWGRGEGGQLGHPIAQLKQKKKSETTEFYIDKPTKIQSIKEAIKVVCGDAHSLILTKAGVVFVFGFCYQGQLGLGLTGDSECFQIFQPKEQEYFKEIKIVDIFIGPTFSFFKSQQNEVYSCGMNDYMQLGIDRVMKIFSKKKYLNRTEELGKKKVGEIEFSKPRRIDMFSKDANLNFEVLNIECGESHCLAQVRYNNQEDMVMGWGLNKNFQIGTDYTEATTPRTLDSLFGLTVNQICCGSTFSLANIGELQYTVHEIEALIKNKIKKIIKQYRIVHR